MDTKERFTEMVMSVDLSPSIREVVDKISGGDADNRQMMLFPSLVDGFSDQTLSYAFMCYTMAQSEEWAQLATAHLINSAMRSAESKAVVENFDLNDELTALSVAAQIMWASGEGLGFMQTLGAMANICIHTGEDYPKSIISLFHSNNGIPTKLGAISAYDILEGKITPDKVLRVIRGTV